MASAKRNRRAGDAAARKKRSAGSLNFFENSQGRAGAQGLLPPSPVDDAVVWLVAHWWTLGRPLVPQLRDRFRLSAPQAIATLRRASAEVRAVRWPK